MALVLIGFMGAGKSSAARELAAATGATALDSDPLVVERLGHSIAEEFDAARRGLVPGGRGGGRVRVCWQMPASER